MAWFLCMVMMLAAMGLVLWQHWRGVQGKRVVERRLRGEKVQINRLGNLVQTLGTSRLGQRSLTMDSESHDLLNRLGWRRANQRAWYAAAQIGLPLASIAVALAVQGVFYPTSQHNWIAPTLALGIGYVLPKRLLATFARRRQQQIAREVSTLIPLLRILFESGLAVEQSLRIACNEGRDLMPALSAELRLVLSRVDSGLQLAPELHKVATLLEVDEFTDTCVILEQLLTQGGGAMRSLLNLKQLLDDRRLTGMQEKVTKMSGKMSVVMMVFLFPALMIVLAGPGFLALTRALSTMKG